MGKCAQVTTHHAATGPANANQKAREDTIFPAEKMDFSYDQQSTNGKSFMVKIGKMSISESSQKYVSLGSNKGKYKLVH